MKKYIAGAVVGAGLMIASVAVAAPVVATLTVGASVPVGSVSTVSGRSSELVKVSDVSGVACYVLVDASGEAVDVSCTR